MARHCKIKGILWIIFMIMLASAGRAPCAQEAGKSRVPADRIRSIIEDYIHGHMPWPVGTVRLVFLSRLTDLTLDAEKYSYHVQTGRNNPFIGDTSFVIRFSGDGALLAEKTVRVSLEVLRNTVVSNRSIQRGTEIAADDVRMVQKWVQRIPLDAATDLSEVRGKRMAVTVRPNTEIKRRMLKDAIMIKRGKVVKIILENGSMSVTAMGVSEEDGVFGETIRVRNLASNKMVYARVVNDSITLLKF